MEYWTEEDIEEAKANGIKYVTFYNRIMEYGMSVEDAKSKPIKPKKFDERIYQLARDNGISIQHLHKRINLGWDHVTAATKEIGKQGRPRRIS